MQEKEMTFRLGTDEIFKDTIGIRVDMNPVIATGHMMRCLSIADGIVELGKKVIFITADEYPLELIKQRGHEAVVLGTDWKKMEEEVSLLSEVISNTNIGRVLVDSYQVTEGYLQELNKIVKVSYLDDLDMFSYPVDQLICYANYYNLFSYGHKGEKEGCYLGMQYVPLRKAFQNCKAKTINKRVKNILLLSGGSDSLGILERMVEVFKEHTDVVLTVVCGSFYKNYEQLVEKYKNWSHFHFCRNVSNMEDYMKKADLAISAGGTTLYELCAVGTPTISYSFVDNQLYTVKQFENDGLIAYAGDVRTEDIFNNVKELVEQYNQDERIRQERSLKMQVMVDGKGAKRIAKILLED